MTTYAYATVADLRGYLDQVAQKAESEALLRACLARARSTIDAELRFAFWALDVDSGAAQETYAAAAARVVRCVPSPLYLRLPPYQQASVTTVVSGEGTTIPGAEWDEDWGAGKFTLRYVGNPYSGALVSPGGWCVEAYTVTAAWGVGPPPESVVEIQLELAVNIWRARAKGGYSEMGGGQAGAVIRAVAGLNAEHRRILARVRRDYQMVGGP